MNKFLTYLLAGNLIISFADGLLGPLYAVFAGKIGGNILEISGAYATYLIARGVLSIIVAELSIKFSKRKFLVIGCVLNAVATFCYLLVDGPAQLFFVQALVGIAFALIEPTWDALFSIHIDKYREAQEWGISDGGVRIVSGIAVILGGTIVTFFGFPALFVVMGSLQLIAAVVLSFIFTQPVKYTKAIRKRVRK